MGDNYRAAGFTSVQRLVRAMLRSESEHLRAFVTFVGNNDAMRRALQALDWATFAAQYNGPKYKINEYDRKLEDAYTQFKEVASDEGGTKPR